MNNWVCFEFQKRCIFLRNCLGCVPLMYAAGSGQVNIFNLIILLTKTMRILIKNSLHRRHQQHPHHHREHPCHPQHNPHEKVEVVKLLLAHPATCLNIRGNDRLTTFMLAMQVYL